MIWLTKSRIIHPRSIIDESDGLRREPKRLDCLLQRNRGNIFDDISFIISLRKLITAYSGASMRVLAWTGSESDGEADVLFEGSTVTIDSPINNLDAVALARSPVPTTLTELVGANTGLVAKRYDQSVNSFDIPMATVSRMPVVVSGGALVESLFDGVNDCMRMASNATLAVSTGSVSWGGWVRIDPACPDEACMFHKSYEQFKIGYGLHRYSTYTRVFSCIKDDVGQQKYPWRNWVTGSWVFLFSTWNSEDKRVSIYLDDSKSSGVNTNIGNIHTTYKFTLGAKASLTSSYYKGYMGDVFVFLNRVLTDDEVAELRAKTDNQIEP